MKIIETAIKDLVIIEPRVFPDSRGYFFESYNQQVLENAGIKTMFVQDNQSKSTNGVIRGLHFQKPPHTQTKLVRALQGSIYDVAVDLRKDSKTYGKWFGCELSEDNKRQLLVPKGFAHGFSVLSETAVVFYKCDDFYHPECEQGIMFYDETLNIDWNVDLSKVIISDKDKKNLEFKSFVTPF